jgi:hypothetical protein
VPWQAIQYVSSSLTLAAFIAAAIVWFLTQKNQEERKRIQTAPEADRSRLVAKTLEIFDVDVSRLPEPQQFAIAMRQINARIERFRLIVVVVLAFGICGTVLSAYTISKAGIERSKSAARADVPQAESSPTPAPQSKLPASGEFRRSESGLPSAAKPGAGPVIPVPTAARAAVTHSKNGSPKTENCEDVKNLDWSDPKDEINVCGPLGHLHFHLVTGNHTDDASVESEPFYIANQLISVGMYRLYQRSHPTRISIPEDAKDDEPLIGFYRAEAMDIAHGFDADIPGFLHWVNAYGAKLAGQGHETELALYDGSLSTVRYTGSGNTPESNSIEVLEWSWRAEQKGPAPGALRLAIMNMKYP